MTEATTSRSAHKEDQHITEDEAAVYDRQIRLWGLEAQNRMRGSTILIINLRSLAAETIKNLVLAGIGKLIVMDSEVVSEEDLGAGFLFREGDGVVGQKRVYAALPQIQSLNPLVKVEPIASSSPFLRRSPDSTEPASDEEMDVWLEKEGVDLVCVTDASRDEMIKINAACRRTSILFYGSASYAFSGFIFSDLGPAFEYVVPLTIQSAPGEPRKMSKERVACCPLSEAVEALKSDSATSPFEGVKKQATTWANPPCYASLLALWEYESKHGSLPSSEEAVEEMMAVAEPCLARWKVNEKAFSSIPLALVQHLAHHSPSEFAPTSAIIGGMLAQDILKALSRKEKPILNLMVFDGTAGGSWIQMWGGGKIDVVL